METFSSSADHELRRSSAELFLRRRYLNWVWSVLNAFVSVFREIIQSSADHQYSISCIERAIRILQAGSNPAWHLQPIDFVEDFLG
jgi:hypothetical protein